jgi:hypothetical protein
MCALADGKKFLSLSMSPLLGSQQENISIKQPNPFSDCRSDCRTLDCIQADPTPLDSGLACRLCRSLSGSKEHETTVQACDDPKDHIRQIEPHGSLHMPRVCTLVRVISSAMEVDDRKDAKGDGPEDAKMVYQRCTTNQEQDRRCTHNRIRSQAKRTCVFTKGSM